MIAGYRKVLGRYGVREAEKHRREFDDLRCYVVFHYGA